MSLSNYQKVLFKNRNTVKKIVIKKMRGKNFSDTIGVPFEEFKKYKETVKRDLSLAEKGYEVYTDFDEYEHRLEFETTYPEKTRDDLPSRYIDPAANPDRDEFSDVIENNPEFEDLFNLLSLQHQKFVTHYLEHRDIVKAVALSGYATKDSISTKRYLGQTLLLDPAIAKVVALGLAHSLSKFKITHQSVIETLLEIRDRALQRKPVLDKHGNYLGEWTCDLKAANTTVKMMGEYLGMYHKTIKHVGYDGGPIRAEINYDFSGLSTEELQYLHDRILPKIKPVQLTEGEDYEVKE